MILEMAASYAVIIGFVMGVIAVLLTMTFMAFMGKWSG